LNSWVLRVNPLRLHVRGLGRRLRAGPIDHRAPAGGHPIRPVRPVAHGRPRDLAMRGGGHAINRNPPVLDPVIVHDIIVDDGGLVEHGTNPGWRHTTMVQVVMEDVTKGDE
jgi:hypothetical protein